MEDAVVTEISSKNPPEERLMLLENNIISVYETLDVIIFILMDISDSDHHFELLHKSWSIKNHEKGRVK